MTTTERIMRRAMGTLAIVALLAATTLIAPQDGTIAFRGHPVMAASTGDAPQISEPGHAAGFEPNS
ncbi:MAG: hypothetical protein O2825_04505 [Proteobacteria bacterium]|nr:hypothetical protein [Pseudomonadota bacterium]